MPLDQRIILIPCGLVVLIFIYISVIYAYQINSERKPDDPKKSQYPPCALAIAPLTFPIIILVGLTTLMLSAIFAVVILIVFTLSLILFRKPTNEETSQIKWLLKIGENLLRINTELLKIFGLYRSPNV